MVEFRVVRLPNLLTPSRSLTLGYISIILVGSLLLMLPVSTADGKGAPFLTAFFTSASSVCVTGLIVVDTEIFWSTFGKSVILVLIQIGGLGYITAYAFLLFLLGRKLSIREMATLKAGLNLPHFGRFKQTVTVALLVSLGFEAIGALLLLRPFYLERGGTQGIFDAIFHSVSAFNNAGFSTFSKNISSFYGNFLVVLVISGLVIFGGIGFFVMLDIYETYILRKKPSLTLHSNVVIKMTALLLLIGTLCTLVFEWNNPRTLGNMPLSQKILNAFATAVFPRTAGFHTIDYAQTTLGLMTLTILFMCVGASPGGTGGGFKTTSLALALKSTYNLFRGMSGTTFFRRKIPARVLINAFALIFLWITILFVATTIITIDSGFKIEDTVFECASALGTVGLSRGITPLLSPLDQLVLVVLMIAGRVGPITVGTFAFREVVSPKLHYPEEEILVG